MAKKRKDQINSRVIEDLKKNPNITTDELVRRHGNPLSKDHSRRHIVRARAWFERDRQPPKAKFIETVASV